MFESFVSGLSGLTLGAKFIVTSGGPNLIMLVIAAILLYLAIKKGVEPLLLVPIAFGCILVNMPLSELMHEGGIIKFFYDIGIITEVFPLIIFIGIGAMTDFGPLLENPKILLFGAAGQLGIFLTLLLALALGFTKLESVCIGVIGACDGPTAIYVTSQYAPHLLGAVSVAAYSYMALVPIIQPPIMRMLITKKEATVKMGVDKSNVSTQTRLLFPIIVTLVTGLIAPKGLPLMGMIMFGNFMKESGVVQRLTGASENELANIVTLFLGLAIGGTMEGH
ncbi:MAG: sodium ion-translocating decarboxylase subunit beta, partial [Pseudomonadota bacterium]